MVSNNRNHQPSSAQCQPKQLPVSCWLYNGTLRLKRDGIHAETRFRLSAKRTISFKSAEASVQSTTGSRGVRISGSNAGYTMFRGSVKSTGYPLHSPVSSSLPLPRASLCAVTFQLDVISAVSGIGHPLSAVRFHRGSNGAHEGVLKRRK
jgi:hypothetical protein